MARPVRDWADSRFVWVLAAAMFAVVTALRFSIDGPGEPYTVLYVLPIGLVANRFGVMAGLISCGVAVALFGGWVAIEHAQSTPGDWLIRCVVFLAVGLGLGSLHRMRARDEQQNSRWFSMSNQMLSEANFDGYLTRVNDAWEECLGHTQEEMMSRPYFDLVHPDDQQPHSTSPAPSPGRTSASSRSETASGQRMAPGAGSRGALALIPSGSTRQQRTSPTQDLRVEREWLLTKSARWPTPMSSRVCPTDARGTTRSVGSCCGASASAWTSRWRCSTSITSSPSMTHTVIPPAIDSFAEQLRDGAGLYAHRITLLEPAARSLRCCSPGVDPARRML